MNAKKFLAVVLMMLLVFTFAACGSSDSGDGGSDSGAPTAETAIPQEAFLTMNGTEVHIGDNFANVDGKIGEETKPSETIQPCNPNLEKPTVEHYYEGVHITTTEDGIIATVSMDVRDGECDSAFGGKVKLHDPISGVKEILGEPEADNEDEMFLTYYFGDDCNIMFYKDEAGNETMDGFVMSCGSLTMVTQE